MSTSPYPVRLEGRLDPGLSRWLWLLKWLLVIPHVVVLAFLWIAFVVLSLIAFVAVLFSGRYPRAIFDFNLGVLRWSWRVGFYAYSALGTDRYPPFTLGAAPDYPARLEMPYPEHLPRGWRLIRWWLIALPHYIVAGVLAGGSAWFVWRAGDWATLLQTGVVTVLVGLAGLVLLFTGRYPRELYDLVLGMDRWVVRAAAYAALMTDVYPPLRLDVGAEEPGKLAIRAADAPAVVAPARPRRSRPWLVVTGSVVALIALALLVGGTALVIMDRTQRDDAGYVMTGAETYTTSTHALVAGSLDTGVEGPDWLYAPARLGRVKLRVGAAGDVFVGIAPTRLVNRYLDDVEHEVLGDLTHGDRDTSMRRGTATPAPPAAAPIWAASVAGSGRHELTWRVREGNWSIVLMNRDGDAGVTARVDAGATLPGLAWIGGGVLIAGVLVGGVAGLLLATGPRGRGGD